MARFKLIVRPEDGSAELLQDGKQVWASDSDDELVEALGARAQDLQADDIGDVLDYLVDQDYMTDYQADHCYIDPGDGETYADLELEDEEDVDDEDDEDDEDEYYDEDEDNGRDQREAW